MLVQRMRCICLVLLLTVSAVSPAQQFQQQLPQQQQQQLPLPLNRIQPLLPRVPRLAPRPSATEHLPFRSQRSPSEKQPISSFLDSLKGSDAAIEIIVGQGRVLTTKEPIAKENGVAVVAVGEPTILDFDILPDPRMLRLIGSRVGITDLTIVTAGGKVYAFEIHVAYDLPLITAQLQQVFPDALIRLTQLREHVVLEGQARSSQQAAKIFETLSLYLQSLQTPQRRQNRRGQGGRADQESPGPVSGQGQPLADGSEADPNATDDPERPPIGIAREEGQRPNTQGTFVAPQIINLLQVPTDQQVMLKVQVAELSRRAAREIGADLTFTSDSGNFIQSIAAGGGNLTGIFPNANFAIVLNALRRNSVVTVLAEPNLVTLSGHTARFQAGGEFPVPVSQFGGGPGNSTVEFKNFGVLLEFTPYVSDNGIIRLNVQPEVSNVDDTLSVTLVEGGDAVPGVRTRNASTTVDMREGQTLAIAGLLSRQTNGTTARVPLLGDLPYLGPLFSDTSHDVDERELVVIVTPYLVGPLESDDRGPLPGQEIYEPNDLEFYLLNRIEGRTGRPFRSTTAWDHPVGSKLHLLLHKKYLFGPVGHSR